MASPLMHIWPDRFEREYPVWGKKLVLRALDNPVVEQINTLASQRPPENQLQDWTVLTVAAAIVSIDGKEFKDEETGKELDLVQRANEVTTWDDQLIAYINSCYIKLSEEYAEVLKAATNPETLGGPAPISEPS